MMQGATLRQVRRKAGVSQAETAQRLGISQALLSLMETGRRSVTPSLAVRVAHLFPVPPEQLPLSARTRHSDEELACDLAALGYPGFVPNDRPPRNPAEVLFDALDRVDLDARVVEALPWLVLSYPAMNWDWLIPLAKLHNRQNRLGFVVSLAARTARRNAMPAVAAGLRSVLAVLQRARLATNDTLCQESWPPSQRRFAHRMRSRLAAFWNLDTRITERDLAHLAA